MCASGGGTVQTVGDQYQRWPQGGKLQPRLGTLFANYVTRSFCGVAILIMILILDWALRLALPWP
jgi:hypothetical protein